MYNLFHKNLISTSKYFGLLKFLTTKCIIILFLLKILKLLVFLVKIIFCEKIIYVGDFTIVSLLSSVNRKTFNNLVKKYNTDFAYKKLSTWEHFITILLGQYGDCESLRDIVETINFHSVEHYHLSLKQSICRSTLSDTNRNRDWRIFRDLFYI